MRHRNSSVREAITDAIKQQQIKGDAILFKIFLPEESLLPAIFPFPCTRGFYAVAFALQAKRRLGLNSPVQCIGFGRNGREGCPDWEIGHHHDEETLLLIALWKVGTEFTHLEWADFGEDRMAGLRKSKKRRCLEDLE